MTVTVVLLFCFFRTFLLIFDDGEFDWSGKEQRAGDGSSNDDDLLLQLRRWRDEEVVPTLLAALNITNRTNRCS